MVPVRRTSYGANPNEEGGVIRAMAFIGVIGLMACSSSSKEVKPDPKPGASAETKSAAPESPEAKAAAEQEKKPLEEIGREAKQLESELPATSDSGDEMLRLRCEYLRKQLAALETRTRILFSISSSISARIALSISSIKPPTSEAGLRQFSDEKP